MFPVSVIVFPLKEAVVPVGSELTVPKVNGAVPAKTIFPLTLFPTCKLLANEFEERENKIV